MAAAHYRLANLTVIVDRNKISQSGPVAEIIGIEPLADKWRAFGWNTLEISGHDIAGVLAAFDTAKAERNLPTMIIAPVKVTGCREPTE
jgi:transketolase